jgi:hypothetical protein
VLAPLPPLLPLVRGGSGGGADSAPLLVADSTPVTRNALPVHASPLMALPPLGRRPFAERSTAATRGPPIRSSFG